MTAAARTRHVLVADDDEASRYLVESLLRSAGYEVRAVGDGQQALEIARVWPVDLLVSDILMPRMDGYRLAQEWKRDPVLNHAPVMFFTATYTDPADERLATDIGADRFVTKPQEPEALLAIVAELLASGGGTGPGAALEEAEVLREYNERLVKKLEDKVAELDDANEELRRAMRILSEEVSAKNDLVERLNQDIIIRRRAQEALREANSALDSVISNSPLPTVAIDERRLVTIWNEAAERLFGWPAHEVLGRSLPFVPKESRREAERIFEMTRDGGRLSGYETRRLTKDGEVIDVAVFTAPIAVGGEGQRNFIAIYQDITERRRIEQVKSDFVSAVSHELRTPLTAILGFSELLASGRTDPGKVPTMAQRIQSKAMELDGLVEELLEAASIQAGFTTIHPMPTSVSELLNGVAGSMQVPAGFKFGVHVEEGLPVVNVDRERMSRAVESLLSNAFKYSPNGGRVELSAARRGDRLGITVSDEGIGLSPEDADRVFDWFTQGDMSSTRSFGGMGLGLYNARQVVEAHGGHIEVDSRPGAGAAFTIDLPLA